MGDGLGPLAIGCVLCECEGGFDRDPKSVSTKIDARIILVIQRLCGRTQCSVSALGQGH